MMIDIEKAKQIEGWMREEELLWLGYQASTAKNILEIGSWMGRSTRALCDNTSGRVTAIDTWKGTPGEHDKWLNDKPENWLYEQFQANTRDLENLYAIRKESIPALHMLSDQRRTFDFIFIDGRHDYASVRGDILGCVPLLKKSSVISGHDYSRSFPGVVQAVRELLPKAKLARAGSIWMCTC